MAKYIPLDAVLAEIDKVMAEEMFFYETACKEGDEEVSSSPMVYTRLQMLRSTINTLEVKEVDLEKETKKWWKERLHLNPENQLWMDAHQSIVFAKHFFEHGLKAQKGE